MNAATTAAGGIDAPPGWHGKLPTLGDFASRRLAPAFLTPWDGWLAAGMQQLRERDPAGWLDAYLAAPSQRFLLMPGVMPGEAGQRAWAGVLMPSVDRVGRYFPFSIAMALPTLPGTTAQLQSLWGWLGRLDELAADALHDDWTIDRLEAELARLAGPGRCTPLPAPAMPAAADGSLVDQPLPPGLDIAQWLAAAAQQQWHERARGLAYWHSGSDHHPPGLRVSKGLPASAADLLGATI